MSRRLQRPANCPVAIATNWLQRVMLRAIRPDLCFSASPSNSCLGTSSGSCANMVLLCATGLVFLCFDWFYAKHNHTTRDVPSPFSAKLMGQQWSAGSTSVPPFGASALR